jgi:amino acid adenylation domain-containing protein
MVRNLASGFFESAERFPERQALVVAGASFSYHSLRQEAARVGATLQSVGGHQSGVVALLAHRSKTAYAGILGILAAGKGYAPLNPKFPLDRTLRMLTLSGSSILIAGAESFANLPNLLSKVTGSLIVVLPDCDVAPAWSKELPKHRFLPAGQMSSGGNLSFSGELASAAIAYLLFTSGSTGQPKGVAIHHSNVQPYVKYVCERYAVTEEDRFSQEFDLTFDLSVHDMFVCWERGACLFSVPEKSVMMPAKFIRDHELTMWFSVPSVVGVLDKMRLLNPGSFPSLRHSLFCGEPLPAKYAALWQRAAVNSTVENLYGPTEATIAITHLRWNSAKHEKEYLNGVVPIGWPFAGQMCRIVDEEKRTVATGESGELCLAGSQVTNGYWSDPDKTRERFVQLPGCDGTTWYRTGDLVKQDAEGCIHYLGRIDHQVKVRGYRIELQEIEAVLRRVCQTEQVVAVGWPVRNGLAEGIIAFVSRNETGDENVVLEECRESLPEYMIPRRIYLRSEFPLNANGKIDRQALIRQLDAKQGQLQETAALQGSVS